MKSLVLLVAIFCYVQKIEVEAQCCPAVVGNDECGCKEVVPPPPPPPCPQPALPCAPSPPPRKSKLGKLKMKPRRKLGGKPPTLKPMPVNCPAELPCGQENSDLSPMLEDPPKLDCAGGEPPHLHFGPNVHIHGGTAIIKALLYDDSLDQDADSPYSVASANPPGCGKSCGECGGCPGEVSEVGIVVKNPPCDSKASM